MTMSPQEVQSAIETIETSYSYEPERWMPSYAALRALQHELHTQLKPYEWISSTFLVLGIAALIGVLILLFSNDLLLSGGNVLLGSIVYATLLSAPAAIMSFRSWLRLRVAARRYPLLVFKSRIEAATQRHEPPAQYVRNDLETNQ